MAIARKGGLLAVKVFASSTHRTGRRLSGGVLTLGVVPDTIAPTITNINPAPDTPIYKNTVITFDVTDNKAFRLIELQVDHLSRREVIHDGDTFLAPFTGSIRTEVVAGKQYSFQITRSGGWQTSPRFYLRAFDAGFNEPDQP